MDHRALKEAADINSTKHSVLSYVGGKISPEMECPKLLWLKRNLPASWQQARKFLDLADFLSYRATAVDTRSLCTVVCKWTFRGKLQYASLYTLYHFILHITLYPISLDIITLYHSRSLYITLNQFA
jgi:ribulose kinase